MPTIGTTETLLVQLVSASPALLQLPLSRLVRDVDATPSPTAILFPLDPAYLLPLVSGTPKSLIT
uniref:Uncharacterized protein n=1 Tax=Arundo donax TaxID=35708 RepID=A0A0A9SHI4_ARUDO